MKNAFKSLTLAIISMFASVVAFAQVTTSSVSGKVTDQSGDSLPGVAIVAVHVPSGTQYFAVTNLEGRYFIQGMRPGGPYTVTATMLGFEPVQVNVASLALGETANVPATLKESSTVLDAVVVSAVGNVDATKTGAAQAISRTQIEEMPSITRGISDVARINPFLRTDSDGAMSFAGVNNRYNSFQIDGAMNNDIFGLTKSGSNGGQAGAQPVSMETIEQVQVNIAPFDVRQSGFTGGSINAITKSGTNEFHGSVYGFGNNQSLYGVYTKADGKLSDKMTDQIQYQAGLTVGGPIIKDKLFFFASFETSNNQYPSSYGLGSDISKVNKDKALEAYNFVKAAATAQGLDYTGELPSNNQVYTKSNKATAKIDWNINDNNHFSFRWSLVGAKQLKSVSSASTLVATNYSYDFVSNTNSFVGELQSRLSDTMNNELRISYVRVRDQRQPLGQRSPMIQIKGIGDGTLCLGNERSSEANRLDQDIITLTDNLTWYKDNHTITFGTHNEFYTFTNLFIQDMYGTYYFDSLDDLKSGKIAQYRLGHANVAVTGDPNWEPTFHAAQLGLYAQDKWAVSDNFDLTYGLRVDVPLFLDKPMANDGFNAHAVAQAWGVKTNQTAKSTPLFSPRVGFRWDINNDGSMVLRGGAGLFTGRIPFVWFSNNYSNTGIQLTTLNVYNPAGISMILDPDGQGANETILAAGAGNQVVNVVDPKFKVAQNAKFDLGFDVNAFGIDWTFEGIFTKNINDVAYKQLAYEMDGTNTVASKYPELSFDTRPMFKKIDGVNPYANIYMLTNTNKGYSYNLMAQARKSFAFGLDLSASYTFTQSKSVFNGTSSVAQSNFAYNYTHTNPNDPELGFSAFNIPHQIKIAATYHKSYGPWTSTAGAVYIGTSGAAYSVYFYGDLNGDSSNGNDLMFIPTDDQIDAMQFTADSKYTVDQQKANMKAWLGRERYLKDHRGEYFERYGDNLPFEHHVDLHFGQKYNFKVASHMHSVELTFDIINFTNMLNPDWGKSYGMGLNNFYSPVTYKGSGKFQFLQSDSYSMLSLANILSRWRGQVGLKYSF